MLKFLDLFAGIGGFRLGMEKAGHKCVGFCEIDQFAPISYRAIHNTQGEWFNNDITTVEPRNIPDFDCICGGFPCQSFSVAGKRGGFKDTRGTLFFEIARIIQNRNPKFVFLENVEGLLTHDGGRTFSTILYTFYELGYYAEWQLLNSRDFGTVQNRPRVFIVAYPREECREPIFPIFGTFKINKRKRAADFRFDAGLRIRGNGTTPCLCASNKTPDISKGIILWDDKRFLTPLEHWRLQGFPDWAFERAKKQLQEHGLSEKQLSNQLYKQAGNSVTVNVIYEIARRLK